MNTFNTSRLSHIYADSHKHGTGLLPRYGNFSNSEQIFTIVHNIVRERAPMVGADRKELVLSNREKLNLLGMRMEGVNRVVITPHIK